MIFGQIRLEIGSILRELFQRKGIIIHETEAYSDQIHMLISIPPKFSLSEIMGYFKEKSSLIILEIHANLKYKYMSRHFWCRGYFIDTVCKNAKKIEEYIKNQLQEDMITDQISMKEYIDPFTGEPVERSMK